MPDTEQPDAPSVGEELQWRELQRQIMRIHRHYHGRKDRFAVAIRETLVRDLLGIYARVQHMFTTEEEPDD